MQAKTVAFALVAILALGAFTAATATAAGATLELAAPVTFPDGADLSVNSARIHASGTALGSTVVWALDEATVKWFSQRQGPCPQKSESTCPPANGFQNSMTRSYDLKDVSVTIRLTDASKLAIVGASSRAGPLETGPSTLNALDADSRVVPPRPASELSDYRDEIRADALVLRSQQGSWPLTGEVTAIPLTTVVTITGKERDSGDAFDRTVQTNWAWVQEGSFEWYRELNLLRISGRGAVPLQWGAPVLMAPGMPFHVKADRLTAPAGDGSLPDGTAAGTGAIDLRDVEADVQGLLTGSDGPRIQMAFAPIAPPDTNDDDEGTNWVQVGGTAAAATAALGGAAWYWPRARYGLTLLMLPMYSRIQRSELLKHDVREKLYEEIKGQPGIHAHALAARTGLGWGTTVYHLRLLEKNRLVTSSRHGRFRRFYPAAGYLAEKKEVLAVLQNETSNAVARYILKNPGENQSALCAALDISPSLANWHVKRLIEAELVKKEQRGRTVHYFPGKAWDDLALEPSVMQGLGHAEA